MSGSLEMQAAVHDLGLRIDASVIRVLVAIVCCALVTVTALFRFYLYLTCGRFRDPIRMNGKTVIVTGASSGIGKETARELARRGARVILACRNPTLAQQVKDELVDDTKNPNIVVKQLNLASFKSIRDFAADLNRTESKLDVLVHNAGTAESKFQLTEDQLELTMATNHYGPFLLTHLLIDLLKKSQPSRIVVVASDLYKLANNNINRFNPSSSWCAGYLYYVSKLANIHFARELARRLSDTNVTVNFLHPGMIQSGIWRNVPVPLSWMVNLVVKCFFKTPIEGSQTTLYLACLEDLKNVSGKYFMDCKEAHLWAKACDDNVAHKLWELSEHLVHLRPDDPKI